MSNEIISSFSLFLQEMQAQIRKICLKAVSDWNRTVNDGALTQFLRETISGLEAEYHTLLHQSQRKTTLISLLYEYLTSFLIKTFFENVQGGSYSVILDTPFKTSLQSSGKAGTIYPDILIQKEGKNIGIIELKYKLKRKGYDEEKKRHKKYSSIFSRYIVLQYWEREIVYVRSLVEDNCRWIFLINPMEQIKQLNNSSVFKSDLEKQQAIQFIDSHNPVERALDLFLQI